MKSPLKSPWFTLISSAAVATLLVLTGCGQEPEALSPEEIDERGLEAARVEIPADKIPSDKVFWFSHDFQMRQITAWSAGTGRPAATIICEDGEKLTSVAYDDSGAIIQAKQTAAGAGVRFDYEAGSVDHARIGCVTLGSDGRYHWALRPKAPTP